MPASPQVGVSGGPVTWVAAHEIGPYSEVADAALAHCVIGVPSGGSGSTRTPQEAAPGAARGSGRQRAVEGAEQRRDSGAQDTAVGAVRCVQAI